MAFDRLKMPIGDAMFTQRSVRRFTPDPIPIEDIQLIVDADSLGIGSVPTTLHPTVTDRVRAMFAIPKDVAFRWGAPVPWT